ncbi:MAG: sensor histidine kinase [Hyphomonadaceae bacterium]|nr:sensor histidine kinase [Hyphomonadaceae bacterium]
MAGRVSERDESLKHAIEVRDDAVKEIHHRVKNNLQIVTSFLNLQSRAVSDDEARYALAAARHRIDALAIVHSTLYQHERVEQVSIKPFLEGLLAHLSEAVGLQDGDIALETSIVQAELEADAAIPIALFVVEAVTHAMLNARDTSNGRIGVLLEQDGSYLKLIVSEEGLGAPDLLDMGKPTGLGGRLMMSFARQLHGRLITERTSELGFGMGIVFPYAHEQRKVA